MRHKTDDMLLETRLVNQVQVIVGVVEEAHYQTGSSSPPPPPQTTTTTITTKPILTISHLTNCYVVAAALAYLHCRQPDSTIAACRIPRICSLTDDYRRCTWCKPTTVRRARPDHHRRSSSSWIAAAATLVADSATVVDSAASSAMADRYKCPGKTPRWSHPAVLRAKSSIIVTR